MFFIVFHLHVAELYIILDLLYAVFKKRTSTQTVGSVKVYMCCESAAFFLPLLIFNYKMLSFICF